jgi:hypothetical protein
VARFQVGIEQARRILGRRATAHQHRSEAQAADAQRPEIYAFHAALYARRPRRRTGLAR